MTHTNTVFADWMADLPMQQQSVLVLALRGPDGIRKHHPCKDIVRAYRGTVLKAAYYGRFLAYGEAADNFMSMKEIADEAAWSQVAKAYFDSVDELPHHYHLHLLHGAQILGFKHPDDSIRSAWNWFYLKGCDDAHMVPESLETMDRRLGDWGQEHWSLPVGEDA